VREADDHYKPVRDHRCTSLRLRNTEAKGGNFSFILFRIYFIIAAHFFCAELSSCELPLIWRGSYNNLIDEIQIKTEAIAKMFETH